MHGFRIEYNFIDYITGGPIDFLVPNMRPVNIWTNTTVWLAQITLMVDEINNNLDFLLDLGNIVRDRLPKVTKNPKPASWDTAKKNKWPPLVKIKQMFCDISLIIPLKHNIFLHI